MNRDHFTFADYEKKISELSATLPEGFDPVFYSGTADGIPNRYRAEEYVKTHPRTGCIEDTPLGKYLDTHNPYPTEESGIVSRRGGRNSPSQIEAKQLWDEASERFAKEAKGHAVCFVDGARPEKTFREKELPALLHNENIPTINGIPRHELQAYGHDTDRAFKRIEEKSRDLPSPHGPSEASKNNPREPARTEPAKSHGNERPAARPLLRHAASEPPRHDDRERGRNIER